MKVSEYAARAKKDILNVASHHDSTREDVVQMLDDLSGYIAQLLSDLTAARKDYVSMRTAEAERDYALKIERLAGLK